MTALYIIIFIETVLILTLVYLFAAAKERLRNCETTQGDVEGHFTEGKPFNNGLTSQQEDIQAAINHSSPRMESPDNNQKQNNQRDSNEVDLLGNTSYTTDITKQQYINKDRISLQYYREINELLHIISDQLSTIAKTSDSDVLNNSGSNVRKHNSHKRKKRKSPKSNNTSTIIQGEENKETVEMIEKS